ncbi:MarR family winged helix-turn-helix transcriptional regulator [Ancylobacter sp. SL191]|uniref:MarR family winged helix-turn-helix transcriptional regulator n=1 Tax=Ancylobacter sp. SL191 TaxID=2995166 RepID=UPI00226D697C|nr:MarR family transcriptional regulator [Ancylobacter sp. SL191]WAC28556.1 MarR family transcriptional regulator [Ancylobacter sp. SL191]
MDDILRRLGHLALGSRLKRLGEQFQADTQHVLDTLDPAVPSGQHPFIAALGALGPLTVGELAQALGVSQPGVTRTIAGLVGRGLVETRPGSRDQRQKVVSLTDAGRRLVDLARSELWPQIDAAVAELCAGLEGPLLDQLTTIEDRLAAEPLHRRVARRRETGR